MDTLFRKRGSASKSRISLNDDILDDPSSPTESLRGVAYADAPLGQIPNSGPSKGSHAPTPNPRSRGGHGTGSMSSLDKQMISAPSTNQALREEGAEIMMTDEPAGLDAGGYAIGGNKIPRTQTMSTVNSASGSVRRQTSIASRLEVLPESGSAHLPGGSTPYAAMAQAPTARRGSAGSLQSLESSQQGFSMRHRYPVYSPNAPGAMSTASIPASARSERFTETSDAASVKSGRSGQTYQVKRAGPDSDRFWVTQPPDEVIEEAFKRLMEQRMDDTRQVTKSSPRKEGHLSLTSSRDATPGAGTPPSQHEAFPFTAVPAPQPVADDIRLDLERKKAEMSSWPISRKWPLVEADLRQAWDRERKQYLAREDKQQRQSSGGPLKESSTRKILNRAMGRLGGNSPAGEERKGFMRSSREIGSKLPDTGEAYIKLLSTMTCGVKEFQKLFQFLKSEEKE
jgi:hypothetical protein